MTRIAKLVSSLLLPLFILAGPVAAFDDPAWKTVQSTAGLSLEEKMTNAIPFECEVAYRFQLAKGERASATLQVSGVNFNIAGAGGGDAVAFSTTAQRDGKPIGASGALALHAVSDRSLAWPEDFRKILEAQMAQAPKLEEMVFTARFLVE